MRRKDGIFIQNNRGEMISVTVFEKGSKNILEIQVLDFRRGKVMGEIITLDPNKTRGLFVEIGPTITVTDVSPMPPYDKVSNENLMTISLPEDFSRNWTVKALVIEL